MFKISNVFVILVLGIVLAMASGCSLPASSVASTSPSGSNASTPVSQTNAGPNQGVQSPGIVLPGTSSPGAPGFAPSAPANAAVAAPAASVFINQPNQPSFILPASGQAQSTGVWVTGQGQVSAVPDVASLNLGVSSQASTVAEAQNNASTSMNAVMQVLKSKGVADNDITTVGFSIYPNINYKNNTVTGYQVNNTIIAKIRKIADAGSIIDGVASAGGNLIRINSISFNVDDPTQFLKQARALAVADASAKASQLAALSGIKLGAPTFVTESTGNHAPVPIYFSAAASAPAPTTPINPGETQISVNVQIVYGIP